MFGYIIGLSLEIFLVLQVLFMLILGVILNNKLILLKYKYNIIRLIVSLLMLILFYAYIILCSSVFVNALLLNYQLIVDNYSYFVKFFLLFMIYICLILSINYNKYAKIKTYEYILLVLLALVGIFSMISSYDLITMYLSIELQSLCFYIITCIKFHSNYSVEAGLKYFILGAISSGFLLFGASLIYGFTGMTNFLDLMILFYYYNMNGFNYINYKIILLGILFLYCGLLFKIGIVPFHMWLIDVYQGAPTHITLLFAVMPQFSIITLLIRLNMIFLYAYLYYMQIFFMILAVLSLTIGTFGAIYQTKLKRIFAFSSVNNMGYLISLMCSLNVDSVFAVIFYLMIYNLISLSLWAFILNVKNKSTNTTFKDIRELVILYNSNKFLAIYFYIILFSAMGLPPLVGFFSKLYLFLNLIDLNMYLFILYLIILNGITAFYYLRLIQVMFSYRTDKRVFIEDIGELKTIILLSIIYLNILFFLAPVNILTVLIYNIVISLLFNV